MSLKKRFYSRKFSLIIVFASKSCTKYLFLNVYENRPLYPIYICILCRWYSKVETESRLQNCSSAQLKKKEKIIVYGPTLIRPPTK